MAPYHFSLPNEKSLDLFMDNLDNQIENQQNRYLVEQREKWFEWIDKIPALKFKDS